ncbi:MAG: hypothetical protein GVY11_08295 [Gammaproteobacteria bacterium]|jgi:competence ComEA-like helix-hairpin-helix protein|nr:hypothetical protein [Gammaproteobacteria bacterium]
MASADLNNSGLADLLQVDGIDTDLALAIMELRARSGAFGSPDDLDRLVQFQSLPAERQARIRSQVTAEPSGPAEMEKRHRAPIGINSASREELMSIRGIGEERADAIIKYREAKQGFRSLDELDTLDVFADAPVEDRDHIKGYLIV